jgi:ATP-dependent protease HslVU (ClpYQ) ATPase subunit
MALAKVEVNSGKDILITIRTGSGQDHRLSSILFLVGSEPLIRVNATRFAEIMYI